MKKLLILTSLFLFTIYHLLLTSPVFADPGPPDPKPCKWDNAVDKPSQLVNNYMVDKNGIPPIVISNYDPVKGQKGDSVDLPARNFDFTIDFSKLQAIFGPTNSNYLEGKYQDSSHNSSDLLGASSTQLNQYNGAAGKTQPKLLTDQLRQKYVDYIFNHPQLPESANKYTDINNQGNPKTVYDLVNQFGQPNPPQSDATDQQKQAWEDSWGKYWPKIPTAWSEFYKGIIMFHWVAGDYQLGLYKTDLKNSCPLPIPQTINFVMPEFYRTTATSDQLNRQIVPKVAQSFQGHGILPGTVAAANSVKDAFAYCWKLLTNPSQIGKSLKNIISSLSAPVLAAEPSPAPLPCLTTFKDSKNGQAPYCPLPQEEVARLGNAVTCSNQNDSFKLEKDNPNVICTFHFNVPRASYTIDPLDHACADSGGGTYTCQPKVYVIPNFRIPWLAAIWNNTLSSENDPGLSNQDQNRPGVYSFFTPQSIYQELFPSTYDKALDMLKKCNPNWPEQGGGDPNACNELNSIGNIVPCAINPDITKVAECLSGKLQKNLPGKVNSQGATLNQKFIGGTDCNKGFVRDIALKPKALQASLNINPDCLANTASFNPVGGSAPGNVDPNSNNCGGIYSLDNPIHENFGDPNCDFTLEKLSQQLNSLDPSNLSTWLTMVSLESGGNPNAFNGSSTSGSAWGLLQMGHQAYPAFGISQQMNNQYDRGDVVWSLQAYNAVNYNRTIGNSFCYWDSAIQSGFATNCN